MSAIRDKTRGFEMLIRLSSNRILNLAEIAEARFTSAPVLGGAGGVQFVAELTLLTSGTGRHLTTVGAVGSEANALSAALRARPEQFAEVDSGHYFNLRAILSADLTKMPEKPPPPVAAPGRPQELIKQLPAVCGWWRCGPRAESVPEAGTFRVTGDAAVRLRDALATYLGAPFDPDPFAPASGGRSGNADGGSQDRGEALAAPAGVADAALA
jgi:hypothetical protein